MDTSHVDAEAAPRILVHGRVADERPARAAWHAHVAALGPATGKAAVGRCRGHSPGQAVVLGDSLVVARLEILPQPSERLEIHRDRDACETRVAREDVRDLVAEQGELGGVGSASVRPEEAGDVPVNSARYAGA